MNTNAINNADVLKTVTCNHMIDGFKQYTKNWPTKFVGPVPSPQQFMVALCFGKQRKPGPESGFIAMMLRPEGCSVAQLCMAFDAGGAAHNHAKALSTDIGPGGVPGLGYFARTKGQGKFWLTFTAKGVKALEKALQGMAAVTAAGEANEAVDKPKAKKATPVAKRGKVTSEAPKAKGKRKGKVTLNETPEVQAMRDAEHAETVAERQLEGPVDSVDQPTNDGGGTVDQRNQPAS